MTVGGERPGSSIAFQACPCVVELSWPPGPRPVPSYTLLPSPRAAMDLSSLATSLQTSTRLTKAEKDLMEKFRGASPCPLHSPPTSSSHNRLARSPTGRLPRQLACPVILARSCV